MKESHVQADGALGKMSKNTKKPLIYILYLSTNHLAVAPEKTDRWEGPYDMLSSHPFPDGNGRVGRALMNFVLERAGYPTLYLGLPHRQQYLDAITPADD